MTKEPLELRILNSVLRTKPGQKTEAAIVTSADYLGPRIFGTDDILSYEELRRLSEEQVHEYRQERGNNIVRVAKNTFSAAVLSFGIVASSPLYVPELEEAGGVWETIAPYVPLSAFPLLGGVFVGSERSRRRKDSELTQQYRERYLQ